VRGARVLAVAAMCAVPAIAMADAVPRYMGVSSCASSQCHGRIDPDPTSNVWLNEYRIWRGDDRHSRAYKALLNPVSRQIAAKLGLGSPHESALCLNCHAMNVPAAERGPKFNLMDGVGCESCHGAAEKWLSSHDDSGVTHQDNLRNGMYPLSDPAARAQRCYGCHMGSSDGFVTHRILGAGHPRLSFELENFTSNQPAHYTLDNDYRRRKGDINGAVLWLSGQIEGSRRFLSLLQTKLMQEGRLVPEFGFYDCQSCHHGLDPKDLRWLPQRRAQGLEPGAMRLQDHHLRMLEIVSDTMTAGETARLRALVNQLVAAGQTNREAIIAGARGLDGWIQSHRADWLRSAGASQMREIRRHLLAQAAAGTVVDYGTAEQGLLSIVTLSAYLGEQERLATPIDELFDSLGNDETFRPARYAAAAKRVAGRF
jgi:hypothetical protein